MIKINQKIKNCLTDKYRRVLLINIIIFLPLITFSCKEKKENCSFYMFSELDKKEQNTAMLELNLSGIITSILNDSHLESGHSEEMILDAISDVENILTINRPLGYHIISKLLVVCDGTTGERISELLLQLFENDTSYFIYFYEKSSLLYKKNVISLLADLYSSYQLYDNVNVEKKIDEISGKIIDSECITNKDGFNNQLKKSIKEFTE